MTLESRIAVLEELHRHACELVTGLEFANLRAQLGSLAVSFRDEVATELTKAQAEQAEVERARGGDHEQLPKLLSGDAPIGKSGSKHA